MFNIEKWRKFQLCLNKQMLNLLCCTCAFCWEIFLTTQIFKRNNVLEIWDKSDGITTAVKSSWPYHTDVTHGIAWNVENK